MKKKTISWPFKYLDIGQSAIMPFTRGDGKTRPFRNACRSFSIKSGREFKYEKTNTELKITRVS